MRSLPRPITEELLYAFIGENPQLPPLDAESQISFIEEYFHAGAPELPRLYNVCLLFLCALSLLMKGKPFSRLAPEDRERLLNRILSSRNPLLRGAAVLLGMPLYMSYYRRPEVSVPLGFDPRALKEEAALRVVTRDRSLPPRGGE